MASTMANGAVDASRVARAGHALSFGLRRQANTLAPQVTDTHIYFFASQDTGSPYDCLQQLYDCHFVEPALRDGRGGSSSAADVSFRSAEQYMMYMKARIMKDDETAARIREATDAREAKRLGREVQNFNQKIWEAGRDAVVERANWLKFGQNPHLTEILLDTGDRQLVEASPDDRIWGIGFNAIEAPGRESEWGENRLGKALMRVRARIASGEKEGEWPRIVTLKGCESCGSCGSNHAAKHYRDLKVS